MRLLIFAVCVMAVFSLTACTSTYSQALPLAEQNVSIEATIRQDLNNRISNSTALILVDKDMLMTNHTEMVYFVVKNAYAVPKTFTMACSIEPALPDSPCVLPYTGATIQPRQTAFNAVNITIPPGSYVYTLTIHDAAKNFYAEKRIAVIRT